jgi:hypothetical protein
MLSPCRLALIYNGPTSTVVGYLNLIHACLHPRPTAWLGFTHTPQKIELPTCRHRCPPAHPPPPPLEGGGWPNPSVACALEPPVCSRHGQRPTHGSCCRRGQRPAHRSRCRRGRRPLHGSHAWEPLPPGAIVVDVLRTAAMPSLLLPVSSPCGTPAPLFHYGSWIIPPLSSPFGGMTLATTFSSKVSPPPSLIVGYNC